MQSQRRAALAAAVRLLCRVPMSRSFAATKPLVTTLTVPQSLDGLRADRVLLALLQVFTHAHAHFRSKLPHILLSLRNANGRSFSGRLEQVAFASEKFRTREQDGELLQTNESHVSETALVAAFILLCAAGAVLSFPAWLGPLKTEDELQRAESAAPKVRPPNECCKATR